MENQYNKSKATSLHDIKEVSKRTVQFIFLSLIIAAAIVPMRLYFEHYISAALLFSCCIFFGIVLFLNKRGYTKYIQASTVAGINIFFILFSYVDGISVFLPLTIRSSFSH
jgi:hypothetical protein